MIYRLLRAVGFRFDAERAHAMALGALRLTGPFRRRRAIDHDPVTMCGLPFPNRVGLAAGYDKDAVAWRALASLGFGHIEIGTVTPLPQPGHLRPRITRYPEREALINRMGFPSAGAEVVARRLDGRRPRGLVVGVSIGPNAFTPPERRLDDYLSLVESFAEVADYLAVNVSSPNTAGLRQLQGETLESVLAAIVAARNAAGGRHPPILVKLSPDLGDIVSAVRAVETSRADGIIVGNTTTTRPGFDGPAAPGGLSGAPLAPLARDALTAVRAATRLPVIACGGIMSAADARDRLAAGATLVQVYTGLVYRGPGLVKEIAR